MKTLNHLDFIESEAIFIIREAISTLKNPALLFSGGKDSITLMHLCMKALMPAKLQFPLLHIDTGHNFQETLDFRDALVKKYDLKLIVGKVEDTIKEKNIIEDTGPRFSRNKLQSLTLLDYIEKHNFDCLITGARRDEERSRAKERVFSLRSTKGEWCNENQRPELWNLYNTNKKSDEHFRVFPLSNWTEQNIWEYIRKENIELPSLYFSHQRDVFLRDGSYYYKAPFMKLEPGEKIEKKMIRFRTLGDVTCSGGIESDATNLDQIMNEIKISRVSERGSRGDDRVNTMEDRKKEGYF